MEIIVALDTHEESKLNFLLQELKTFKPYYKIGMELFYTNPDMVMKLKDQGHKVFLDLKLHDIPNTVEKALTSLKRYNVDLINVHTQGGKVMMEKAANVFHQTKTLIIGVTQLTSSDESTLRDLGIKLSINESVLKLATLAKVSGLHGVVSSPLEVPIIKEQLGNNFITVTPGIRLDSNTHDQKRVTTPLQAKELGTDYIVIGRPITENQSPAQVYQSILKDIV
ncbi:MAG: orotidine-5'-phosphate decarboxylase [Bacteriovoracaceae bacterium]